ncbi:MAG: peptidase M23 [Chitinophagaceae bacterium]|nr:MAG: peptidase M23 [Chitinophagaceae bacterium]
MSLHAALLHNKEEFARVVSFTPGIDRLLHLDFTENNGELTEQLVADTQLFSNYITRTLEVADAKYGIGGYDEHRTFYNRSALFGTDDKLTPSPVRRLHLGIDIWGEANTPVMAPLDGIVHSFAFNDAYGDYGTTIILKHTIGGTTFHTLYGHLGLSAIKYLKEGDLIKKGESFASFGIETENGHWPSHLHFQLIEDLKGWKGDYPGVCAYAEKETGVSFQ